MYGTLDEKPVASHPLLSEEQRNASRVLLQSPKRGMARRSSDRPSVLSEILKKPNRRPNQDLGPPVLVVAEGQRPKSFVYIMLNPRSSALQAVVFKWFIAFVIIADLVIFAISTEPDLDDATTIHFHTWEGITSSIFLVEFFARLITVTESKKYGDLGPIRGRLKYCTTYSAVIDIFATFPFFVELVSGWDLPTLTYLRSFRIIRILKTSGFAAATNAVYRVIYYNREILYVAMLICVGLVIFTAVLMYYLRPQDDEYSQGKSGVAT
jgi:hypothetical protein